MKIEKTGRYSVAHNTRILSAHITLDEDQDDLVGLRFTAGIVHMLYLADQDVYVAVNTDTGEMNDVLYVPEPEEAGTLFIERETAVFVEAQDDLVRLQRAYLQGALPSHEYLGILTMVTNPSWKHAATRNGTDAHVARCNLVRAISGVDLDEIAL